MAFLAEERVLPVFLEVVDVFVYFFGGIPDC